MSCGLRDVLELETLDTPAVLVASDAFVQAAGSWKGVIDTEEFKRRRGRVYAAVTPRELWKATGHRAGSRERADKADLWRSLRLQLAIVAFAAVIMMFVLLGTILNNQGGTRNTPVFPWEWGKDQPKDQPAQP